MNKKLAAFYHHIPGRAYLLISIFIFAASNAIIKVINNLGEQHPINGRNPISFCNVLFASNLIAFCVLIGLNYKQCSPSQLSKLTLPNWVYIILISTLSGALAPAMTFMALELTTVNNVILIGRIEPPLALFLAIIFLKDRVGRFTIIGSIISLIGVSLTIILQPSSSDIIQTTIPMIGKGELFALTGAISLAISTIFSRLAIKNITLGLFSTLRAALSLIIFFSVVIIRFSPQHFIDVASPFLWQWMLIYGGVIIVGGQLCWFAGLKTSTAADVSLASSFTPLAGVLAAFLILGDVPTTGQYIGGVVIILGILLNQLDLKKQSQKQLQPSKINSAKELDMEVGFKGM
jgi:drug/metabolite transporter (DMT)-like permease